MLVLAIGLAVRSEGQAKVSLHRPTPAQKHDCQDERELVPGGDHEVALTLLQIATFFTEG
jgi:hypothetical protein